MNTIVLVIGVAAGAAIMWGILNFFNYFARKNDTRSSTSFSEVVKINEMVSLRHYFQHMIEKSQTIWFSTSKILLICKGRIECRFDMSKVNLEPNEENKWVRIKMPPCNITGPIIEINEKDVRVYDATRGVIDYIADWGRDESMYSFNNVIKIIEQEKPEILKEARENLQLEKLAKENARRVLEKLAKKFGYTAEISFEDDDNTKSTPIKALGAGSSSAGEVIELEGEAISEEIPAR